MSVIVTGTGRSGTSAVARVLYDGFGIFMGDRFDPPSRSSPFGSWEDLDFRDLHVDVNGGAIDVAEFEARARQLISARTAEHGDRWGFKDPRVSYQMDFYLREMPDVLLVIPYRRIGTVAESIHRHYGTPEHVGRRESEARLLEIEEALVWNLGSSVSEAVTYAMRRCETLAAGPVLALNMDDHRTDEWLCDRLTAGIGTLQPARSHVS